MDDEDPPPRFLPRRKYEAGSNPDSKKFKNLQTPTTIKNKMVFVSETSSPTPTTSTAAQVTEDTSHQNNDTNEIISKNTNNPTTNYPNTIISNTNSSNPNNPNNSANTDKSIISQSIHPNNSHSNHPTPIAATTNTNQEDFHNYKTYQNTQILYNKLHPGPFYVLVKTDEPISSKRKNSELHLYAKLTNANINYHFVSKNIAYKTFRLTFNNSDSANSFVLDSKMH
ncbi:conserved oligomeric Golgi complex subunit 8-like isoform X6 [Musca domestica]|uniref:Conserved oligomeric Golgi complex subunit 8-like isoform X6 n=1 Tax=Musca domestica TaxID=7370 RepID=A0ABM3VE32_MUSDO|nr:conserved oligomeric Golgi complex subunit 8-like isoform X6 [Musca domestica]